jgi:hypothetical protein
MHFSQPYVQNPTCQEADQKKQDEPISVGDLIDFTDKTKKEEQE